MTEKKRFALRERGIALLILGGVALLLAVGAASVDGAKSLAFGITFPLGICLVLVGWALVERSRGRS